MNPYTEFEGQYYEYPESEFEFPLKSACAATAPLPNSRTKPLSAGRVQKCHKDAYDTLKKVIESAVTMMDNTISELTAAREAVCRVGLAPLKLRPITECWLRYKLGVCITLESVWLSPSVRPNEQERVTVAEVIRRLVGPRDLLATNQITYVCEPFEDPSKKTNPDKPNCNNEDNPAFVNLLWGSGRCFSDQIMHLCPPFWRPGHADFREQTIIHEAVHMTHCAGGREDKVPGHSIGNPECLDQFVLATNGRKLDSELVKQCTFTDECGLVPRKLRETNACS